MGHTKYIWKYMGHTFGKYMLHCENWVTFKKWVTL